MKKTLYIISILLFLIGCSTEPKKSLFEKIERKGKVFLINNQQDTLIEGEKGTLIFIEKNSFINVYGETISDSVEIVLKEVYQIEDIIVQNISMKSNGKLLETGGMIHLKASSNGDELILIHGKEVIIQFPKEGKNEMNLFYGKIDSNEVLEWDLEEASTYQLVDSIIPWFTKHDSLDNQHLYLDSDEIWYSALPRLFNLSEKDKEELVNKTVELNYVVSKKGELRFQNTTGSKINRRLRKKLQKVVKNFPKCKPYTQKGIPIDMDGFFKIFTKVLQPKYKSKENYLKLIEQKFSDGDLKGLDIAELQYYIFDSKRLGWMNCDRFINSSSELVSYVVKVPRSKNIFTKIIFTNYKTVMTGHEKNGKFIFDDLPLNEPVKIVVLDERKGIPFMKIIDTITSEIPIEITDLEKYSLEELQNKLKELN